MKEKYKTCQRADKLHRSNSYMFQVVECNRYMKRIKDGKYIWHSEQTTDDYYYIDEKAEKRERKINGRAYCSRYFDPPRCNGKRCGHCGVNKEILERLATYEENGMIPEQEDRVRKAYEYGHQAGRNETIEEMELHMRSWQMRKESEADGKDKDHEKTPG